MRLVMQTAFCDPAVPSRRGNCLQAVVASALGLELDEVPHFVQEAQDGGENWWTHLVGFLHDRGWRLAGVPPDRPPAGVLCLAAGPSPRGHGLHHIVVYRDGAMVHDPHPDGTGLLGVETCWALLPATAS